MTNRPGLSAIANRIGTFATFRAALLDSLGEEPALAALTTRTSDDYAVTIEEQRGTPGRAFGPAQHLDPQPFAVDLRAFGKDGGADHRGLPASDHPVT